MSETTAAVIGAGPAGLMAAQMLAEAGVAVDVFDAMPSAGRKFLLAGKGGLNLTHSEPVPSFTGRYRLGGEGEALPPSLPGLQAWGPQAVRDWALGLGIDTFVGSSGRVFPTEMKAAPLLRAWMQRLRRQGVRFHMRHRCLGLGLQGGWRLVSPQGERWVHPRATVLALGGASWSRLGSDGAWVPWLRDLGVGVNELQPSNCGFDVGWSVHFRERFAGAPLKSVALQWTQSSGGTSGHQRQLGECVVTDTGLEGSLIYAASADLRETLRREGRAVLHLDLLPARDAAWVQAEVTRGRGRRSLSTHLKSRLGLDGVKMGLLHERLSREQMQDGPALARAIKSLPVEVTSPRPIDEAISCAGGVTWDALDDGLMFRSLPGVFCAGEMLDWEAPTGGYLLTGCLSTGRLAGMAAVRWLAAPHEDRPIG